MKWKMWLVAIAAVVLFCPEVAGADVYVRCDRDPDALREWLERASEPRALRRPYTFLIRGFCKGPIVISRSNTTLTGYFGDPERDGITGPALYNPLVQRALVRVIDARNIRFENLTITGSEARGLEGVGISKIEIVNSRIIGNDGRGLQIGGSATAVVEDTLIADNGEVDLITFDSALLYCTRCTASDDDTVVVMAVRGSEIVLTDSRVMTGGDVALWAWGGGGSAIYGDNTDVAAADVALFALQGSEIDWTGGLLDGSIWATRASRILLTGVTQTANSAVNVANHESHFRIDGGSFVNDTYLTGFSSGTAEVGASFDTLSCDRGGDFYCDGSTTMTSSSCGLCPAGLAPQTSHNPLRGELVRAYQERLQQRRPPRQ